MVMKTLYFVFIIIYFGGLFYMTYKEFHVSKDCKDVYYCTDNNCKYRHFCWVYHPTITKEEAQELIHYLEEQKVKQNDPDTSLTSRGHSNNMRNQQ